jgi:adenosine deaminase
VGREHFTSLQDFLDAYNIAMTVLVTEDDFYQLTKAYLDKAATNNITHVEIFFDAQHHLSRYKAGQQMPVTLLLTYFDVSAEHIQCRHIMPSRRGDCPHVDVAG